MALRLLLPVKPLQGLWANFKAVTEIAWTRRSPQESWELTLTPNTLCFKKRFGRELPPVISVLKGLSCYWRQETPKLAIAGLCEYNDPAYTARAAQPELEPPGTLSQVCCLGSSPQRSPNGMVTPADIEKNQDFQYHAEALLHNLPSCVWLGHTRSWLSLQVYIKSSPKHQAFAGLLLIMNGITCKIFTENSRRVEKHK